VHRIGRTGRMQENGLALSLCPAEDRFVATRIEKYMARPLSWNPLPKRKAGSGRPRQAPMMTLLVLEGKKAKMRAGDLLGALTGEGGLSRDQVGKITITEQVSYVALDRAIAPGAFARLRNITVKGRKQRMKLLGD
jgi:ATP-independent RNA helicase DbpA